MSFLDNLFKDPKYQTTDPRKPEERSELAERSPLNHTDAIRIPLLVVQGANDVRVRRDHSDSVVEALRARQHEVEYLLFPDEGHGFQKPENRLSYIAIAEAFFAHHLGGAFEPLGCDFDGSSHEVRAGADLLAHYLSSQRESPCA